MSPKKSGHVMTETNHNSSFTVYNKSLKQEES